MPPPVRTSLLSRITQYWDPVYLRAWSRRYRGQPGLRAFAVRQLEVFILTARSIHQEEITQRAAALTYHTLLSIVPLLAVGFALFKAFGGLQKLEGPLRQVVLENLAVGRGEEVGRWLDQFINNISAGAIAGVGVILLFYSAMGLLTNIERSINQIWGIDRGRPFYIRFAIYWCLLTLAPPLMGLSVSFSARLQNSEFTRTVFEWLPFGLGKLLLTLGSGVSVCVAFLLTYLIIPNTKVRLKPAILGGVVAGILWSVSKYLFILTSAGSLKYSAVYGALGVLPLLMIWTYLSWIIVLFGAAYTYANQTVATGSLDLAFERIQPREREVLAVRLTTEAARDFLAGNPPPTAEVLTRRVGVALTVIQRCLGLLTRQGILIEACSEAEGGYLPARDLQELTLKQIIEVIQEEGVHLTLEEDATHQHIQRVLAEAAAPSAAILARKDLRAFAAELTPAPTEQPASEGAEPSP